MANKLEICKAYSKYAKELQNKYCDGMGILSCFLDGFADMSNIDKIEFISKEEEFNEKWRIHGAYRATYEVYEYPTTSPHDEGWSTRPCNKLEETYAYFPKFIFDDLSEDELRTKTRQLFFESLKKDLLEDVDDEKATIRRSEKTIKKLLRRIEEIEDIKNGKEPIRSENEDDKTKVFGYGGACAWCTLFSCSGPFCQYYGGSTGQRKPSAGPKKNNG